MAEFTLPIMLQFLQTAGILVGIIYYLTIMRNQQKTMELTLKAQEHTLEARQTQIFMQLYQQLNSEDTHKSWADLMNLEISDYDDYLHKYDSSINTAHYAKRTHIWYIYDTIGELLRQGIIEPDLVHRLSLSIMVVPMWEKWGDIIRANRMRESAPDLWDGFEYLYDELKMLRNRKEYPKITYPQQN